MTKSDPTQRHGLDGFYDALRRPGITRANDGRWFAGVSAGIARRLGVDPLVIRAAFILFSLFFGMGVTLYLVLWLLLPDEQGQISLERALKHGEGGSIFLLVVTVIAFLGGGPWGDGSWQGLRLGGLVLVGAGVWWWLTQTDSGRDLMATKPWRSSAPSPTSSTSQAQPPHWPHSPEAHRSTGNAAAAAGATLHTPEALSPLPPAPAPTPPSPSTSAIGLGGGLLVLGLACVTGAAITFYASDESWSGNPVAVGIAAGVALLGLTAVIAGLAGRRTGWISPFMWLGMIAAVVLTWLPAGLVHPFSVGERVHTVAVLDADNSYDLAVGQLTVDLSAAPYAETPTRPDPVSAALGIGELNLVIPDGVRVTVHASGRAGELVAEGANEGTSTGEFRRDGTGWSETLTWGSPTAAEEIVVDAEVGLGVIRIVEATP